MTNAAEPTQHLCQSVATHLTRLEGREVDVKLVRVIRRWSCHLYRFSADLGGERRALMVKMPVDRRTPSPDRLTGDRPRLKPLTDLAEKYHYEFTALSAIDRHVRQLEDPRFDSVRMLAVLPEFRAIVMEEVPHPTLRQLLLKLHRLKSRRLTPDLRTACHNAGAWLRVYHDLPRMEYTRPRHTRREDFVDGARQFCEFLGANLGHEGWFQNVFATVERAASRVLPDELPLGIGHGDFAPRNIFVAESGRVAVFDTLGRWEVPIYEDLASFLVAMRMPGMQLYTRDLWLHSGLLDGCEREVLSGYFSDGHFSEFEQHTGAIRLFELQALLNRWCSLVAGRNTSRRLKRVIKRVRLAWENGSFRRNAKRLLRELGAGPQAAASATP